MKWWTIQTVRSLIAATIGLASVQASLAQAEVPAKGEIRKSILDARSQVKDVAVEFTFSLASEAPQNAVTREHWSVQWGQGRILLDRRYTLRGPNGEREAHIGASFDGEMAWGFQSVNRVASCQAKPNLPKIGTKGSGFFDLMMWFPAEEIAEGMVPLTDVTALLGSQASQLRPELETLPSGEVCAVLEVLKDDGPPVIVVWLDVNRGYLPVRHRTYRRTGDKPTVWTQYEVLNAMELLPGLWIPTEGIRWSVLNPTEIDPDADADAPNVIIVHRLNLAKDVGTGAYAVTLNTDAPDSEFRYVDRLPAGTMVLNLDTGESHIHSKPANEAVKGVR